MGYSDCLKIQGNTRPNNEFFFTKDIQSKKQFKALINDIKSNSKTTPFLSIDQEGGRVERTENIHERFLSPMFAYKKGKEFLENQNSLMLDELKDFGINIKTKYYVGNKVYERNTDDSINDDIISGIICEKDYYIDKFCQENNQEECNLTLDIAAFDIEVAGADYEGFPDESIAPCEVNMITYFNDKTNTLTVI